MDLQEIINRIIEKGWRQYTFREGEVQFMFDTYNQLVDEGKIEGNNERDINCSGCRTHVFHGLAQYLRGE